MSAHNITLTSSSLSRFQIVGGRRTEVDDDNETFGSVRTPLSGRGQRIAPKLVSWCHAQSSFQSNDNRNDTKRQFGDISCDGV